MTSKFPLLVVLGELAEELKSKDLLLDLHWIPRDQNIEADALSNEVFNGFDLAKRVEVDLYKVTWKILPELMAAAEEVYLQIKDARAAGQHLIGRAAKKSKSLKVTEPWDA